MTANPEQQILYRANIEKFDAFSDSKLLMEFYQNFIMFKIISKFVSVD